MPRIPALFAIAALTIPVTAIAAPQPRSVTITLGDLDPESAADQSILALRIQRAARAVCRAEVLGSLPRTIRAERQCLREALARAEADAKARMAAQDAADARGG